MELVIIIGSIIFFVFIVLLSTGYFDGKSVEEQRKEYIEKYGYPEETVTFGDSRGRLGCIIGKRVLRDTMNHPVMKRIEKEINEKGYSCPEQWEYEKEQE